MFIKLHKNHLQALLMTLHAAGANEITMTINQFGEVDYETSNSSGR